MRSQPFELAVRWLDEMVDHARAEAPCEACGLLAGPSGGPVELLYRMINRLRSSTRYEIDPLQLLGALREIEDRGWGDPLGVYHSHPTGPSYPSPTDLAEATFADGTPLYPATLHFIVSLADANRPTLRAFHLSHGRAIEVALKIC